jgi:hypothetical protein
MEGNHLLRFAARYINTLRAVQCVICLSFPGKGWEPGNGVLRAKPHLLPSQDLGQRVYGQVRARLVHSVFAEDQIDSIKTRHQHTVCVVLVRRYTEEVPYCYSAKARAGVFAVRTRPSMCGV